MERDGGKGKTPLVRQSCSAPGTVALALLGQSVGAQEGPAGLRPAAGGLQRWSHFPGE